MTEIINEDEPILEWLDDAYIQKIIFAHEAQEIEIIKYVKEAATKKGENFASSLNRIRVQYCLDSNDQLKSLSLIVKSRLGGEILADIESQFSIYDREAQMYKYILKSCEDLLRTIGDDTQFGPGAIYVDERVIVLEDLKERGYAMMDVRKGLNQDLCKQVLEKAAKLHATTKILYDKHPELFRYHIEGNLTEARTPLHDIYENTIDTCIKYVTTKEDLSQYEGKLEKFGKNIISKLIGVFTRDENEFNVLNHGDMWVNNFMFKRNSAGDIIDVLFVDYQEGYFGSPGIDFNFFIYSSWTDDVYKYHRDELIEFYHKVLTTTLKQLGSSSNPSLEAIHQAIQTKGDHGIVTACCLYPILTTDRPDLADPIVLAVDDEGSDDKRFKIFDSECFYNKMKLCLPDFVKRGLLQ